MKLLTLAAPAMLLACGAFAAPPALAAGSTNAATDDLVAMARWQFDAELDATVHYHPDESIVIDEDTNLAGTWIVDSFEIRAGAIVVATSDLTVIARRFVSVEGAILGAHRNTAGVSLILRAFDWISVTGELRAGDGLSGSTPEVERAKSSRGGDLWVVSPSGIAPGDLWAGNGASPRLLADGGDGGDGVLIGGVRGTEYVKAPMINGGGGGTGGASLTSERGEGFSVAGGGGNGGHGMSFATSQAKPLSRKTVPFSVKATSFQLCASAYAMSASSSFLVSSAAMAMLNDPAPLPCFNDKGDNGTPGTDTDSSLGGDGGVADPPSACCKNGQDGTGNGGGGVGGTGGHGGVGMPGGSSGGHGGWGGLGGFGGDSYGGDGEDGADATDCCDAEGAGCGARYCQTGGSGATGGSNGIPGSGGAGGAFGAATGDCTDGQDGEGGGGGNKIGGSGGNGGMIGNSESGTRHPTRPWRGWGGEGGGANVNCGGGGGGLDGWNGNPAAGMYWLDLTDRASWPLHGPCGSKVKGESGSPDETVPQRCDDL